MVEASLAAGGGPLESLGMAKEQEQEQDLGQAEAGLCSQYYLPLFRDRLGKV